MGDASARDPLVKPGDIVEGRYRILSTLGEGGMGTVFLAEHQLIKRRVAIKILHPELATDGDVIERFMNEARAAGTLGHPNIVESTDMGFTHGHVPYIVFEFLEGTLLTEEVYRVGGLPVRRAVWIARQIASALHAAHAVEIVHRDLKSDNVFLTDRDDALDHVKVLDFGISRFLALGGDEQTRAGMVMGTPEFMAPEQITAPDSVDRRADIYALGVILYEMLTARRPFPPDGDARALMQRVVNEAPPPLARDDVPPALATMILTKLLAKDPDARFQTMMDVEAALEAFATDGGDARVVRRSRPIDVVESAAARSSTTLPAMASAVTTPWPSRRAPTAPGATNASAPATVASTRAPRVMMAIAAAGLAIGVGGVIYGLRQAGGPSGSRAPTSPSAAPIATAPPVAPAAAAPIASVPTAATIASPAKCESAKIEVTLDADVAGARVTFRRRVSVVPTTMQLTASEVVELVEVSAPGYHTVRYWLTLDHPTTLRAHLDKGSGLVEATDVDTAAALARPPS